MSSRYHYDEFGIPLDAKKFDPNWPGPDNLFGYTGLGYDFASGLTYARARYYQPEIGRFVSEDTYKGDLWEPQSHNQYVYVENNPVGYVDLTGNRKMVVYDKVKKEYSYFYSPGLLDGVEKVVGYVPFSSLVQEGARMLSNHYRDKAYLEFDSSTELLADVSQNTALDLLDIIGMIGSDKVTSSVGNVANYISLFQQTGELLEVVFRDDTDKLVMDLISPGLMVSNRKNQIEIRHQFAAYMINDMINSGNLVYDYDGGTLTHNLTKTEIQDLNLALLEFMKQTGAYEKEGYY